MSFLNVQEDKLANRLFFMVFLIFTTVFLLSCSVSDKDSTNENRPLDLDNMDPIGNDPQVEPLFDINVQGTSEFETDDVEFVTEDGYSLIYLHEEIINPFSEWEMTVNKESGDPDSGYGLVFGAYDSQGASGITMLVFMINTRGEYLMGVIRDSVYFEVIPWTGSKLLVSGLNQDNTIRITRDDDTDTFSFYLNGELEANYTETSIPYHWGGQNGYIVVTSAEENFPDEPVRVLFKNN